MTRNDTEKRLSDIENMLRKSTQNNSTTVCRPLFAVFIWLKPYVIPFFLGMIIGNFAAVVFAPQPTLEQQAALGGAVIPFPNGSPSPSPSYLPPKDSKAGANGSSWKNTSELPSPVNRPADNGQAASTRLFRRLVRPIR